MRRSNIIVLASLLAVASVACGEEIVIPATRDAGIHDANGGVNNMGGHTHVPIGQTDTGRTNRSLFDFDILNSVPVGAIITNVEFRFEVTQQGGVFNPSFFTTDLRRLTRFWVEGTGDGNRGEPTSSAVNFQIASADEPWQTPGGDFVNFSSGTVLVAGPNEYVISSAQLVDDVQQIVNGEIEDFGFILIAANQIDRSAARVTSREGGNPATLTVEFVDNQVLIGDVNLDGNVNLLDVAPFVALLSNGNFQAEADANNDGVVSLLDVSPFVNLLTGN